MSRLRPAPAARYIRAKAVALVDQERDHGADLELTGEGAPNYASWVGELCRPPLGHRVLEVGAGLWAITARYGQRREVVVNDVSPTCVQALRERFPGHRNMRVEDRDLRILELDKRFDSVLMVNVLECIADDVEPLADLSRLLLPGGDVILYVLGLNGPYGALDSKIGHDRRHSVWRLREVGLEPVGRRAVNLLAVPGVGRIRPGRRQRFPAQQHAPLDVGSQRGAVRAPARGPCARVDRVERPGRRWQARRRG